MTETKCNRLTTLGSQNSPNQLFFNKKISEPRETNWNELEQTESTLKKLNQL